MKSMTKGFVLATLLGLMVGSGHAHAGLITLYDPDDPTSVSYDRTPQAFYTRFQAINNVQLTGVAVNYDPGPGNSAPGFFWFISSSSGTLLATSGYEPPLGQPDPGFGTYETQVSVALQAGQYYVISFQANNDPNGVGLVQDATLPFVTSDGNFEVVGTVNSDLAQISVQVAPEPSTMIPASIASLIGLAYAWRRGKTKPAA